MLMTTLNEIREHSPCRDGWMKLLSRLGKTKADDDTLGFDTILKSNGLDDALWCLRALPEGMENECRLLACDFAEPALKYITSGDDRPAKAIWTARQFAAGRATQDELDAARAAAWDAWDAWDAARNMEAAAGDAARAAAGAAVGDARDAAWDAWAARDAARAAAGDAWDAWPAAGDARDAQKKTFVAWISKF